MGGVLWPIFKVENPTTFPLHTQLLTQQKETEREADRMASSRASSSLGLQTRHIKAVSAFEQGQMPKVPKAQVGGYELPSP